MTNCVISVKRAGVTQDYPSDGDPLNISIRELDVGVGSAYDYAINVTGADGAPLTMDEDWEIAVNLGSTFPGETFSRGREVTVTRGGSATSRTVTIAFEPVRMAEGPCGPSGGCPPIASVLRDGYLEAWIGDLSYLSDPDDRAAMRGFDLATNAEWVSSPLQLDYATHAIVLDVANAHWEPASAAVFVGSAQFRIPFPMLSRVYDVDDPASLTPAAFTVGDGTGPAPTISVSVGASDVDVTMENLTFSKRRLRIHGDMVPGRPRDLIASRTSATRAVLRFDRSLPRGSKVRGYNAVCRTSSDVVRKSGDGSPLRLRGLTGGRYACTLRATSKAGLGRVARVSIPRD
jgi:hypothetical protein